MTWRNNMAHCSHYRASVDECERRIVHGWRDGRTVCGIKPGTNSRDSFWEPTAYPVSCQNCLKRTKTTDER